MDLRGLPSNRGVFQVAVYRAEVDSQVHEDPETNKIQRHCYLITQGASWSVLEASYNLEHQPGAPLFQRGSNPGPDFKQHSLAYDRANLYVDYPDSK